MSHIRVLVADMPELHRDIVRRIIGEQPDMVIVGDVAESGRLHHAITDSEPDVILSSTPPAGMLGNYLSMIADHPQLGVVVIDPEGRQGFLQVQMSPRRHDPWVQSLVQAIRHTAASVAETAPAVEPGPGP